MRIAGISRHGLVAFVALVLVATACGSSDAAPPPPATRVPATAPALDTSVEAPWVGGGSAAAYAGMLPTLLGAPKRPPVDPLALLALLLKPSGPPYKTGPNKDSPVVIPPFALPAGDGTVYAVGDSVLLGTKDYLPTTLGGWDLRLDARVGRTMPEGLSIISDNRASIGQAMIICLGHNYGGGGKFISYLDQLMAMTPKVQRVIVMTVAEWSPAQVEVNRAVRALPAIYSNVVVADWQAVVAANPQFLISDHVHPTAAGRVALANLLGVLLGPAKPNGRSVPPPRILPLPDDAPVSTGSTAAPTSTTSTSSTSTTSTTEPVATTTTTSGTTTTVPATTTTTP
jgi:hypothetical protein